MSQTRTPKRKKNRDVPQEELNLVEFTAGQVAEPGADAPEVDSDDRVARAGHGRQRRQSSGSY